MTLYFLDPEDNKIKRWWLSQNKPAVLLIEKRNLALKQGIIAWIGPCNEEIYYPCVGDVCSGTCRKICVGEVSKKAWDSLS